jgi:hypothetical protein
MPCGLSYSGKRRSSRKRSSRTRSRSQKCPSKFIVRKGYYRKSYRKKSGTRVKAKYIPPVCSVGLTKYGKRKIIPPLNKGTLGKYGYSININMESRHRALRKAIRDLGALSVFRKLNVVATFNKSRPDIKKIFIKDRDWVRDKYM